MSTDKGSGSELMSDGNMDVDGDGDGDVDGQADASHPHFQASSTPWVKSTQNPGKSPVLALPEVYNYKYQTFYLQLLYPLPLFLIIIIQLYIENCNNG